MKITSNVNLNANVINNRNDNNVGVKKVENNLTSEVKDINMIAKDSQDVEFKETDTSKSSIGGYFKKVADKFNYVTSEVSKFVKTSVSVGESVVKTVKSVSNTIVDTANVVSKSIKDMSDSVSKKIKDTAAQVASSYKQVTTTAAEMKKVAEEIKNSATSLVNTGVKTAVTIGKNIQGVVEKVGTTVSEIKAEWKDPNNGIIDKVVKTGTKLKDGVEAIKAPIKEIGNTASTGYNEIQKHYQDIRNNVEKELSYINEVKDTVVSVSKNVLDTIKTVSDEVKNTSVTVYTSISDASTNIKNTVSTGYKEINETIQAYKGNEKGIDNLENNDGMIPVLV